MPNGDADQPAQGLPGRVLGRVVGSVVNPIVESVDVEQVVERIDVNHVLDEIDVNRLLDRIDVSRLLDRIDVSRLLDRIDPNPLVERLDPNPLVERLDPNPLVERLDPNPLVERLDPNPLVERLDIDLLLERIDLDALIEHVDIDRVVRRIDLDAMLARLDPNEVMERVDLDALLERVDVNGVVERTELGAIITRSTAGVFTQVLDVARAEIVVGDQIVQGIPARALRGTGREIPPRPGEPDDQRTPEAMAPSERAVAVQGRAAGSLSRFLAFLVDQFTIGVLFGIGALLVQTAVEVVTGSRIDVDEARPAMTIGYGVWAFVYVAGSLAASGRTFGKAILGLLVVRADGSRLDARHASLRTIAFPLSFLLFGVGFLIGLGRRDRRQLHDLIGGTSVVYAWDAQAALLRTEAGTAGGALSTPTTVPDPAD